MTWVDRITFDPTVMGGKPCIRHMRMTVGTIVGLIAAGRKTDVITRKIWGSLKKSDEAAIDREKMREILGGEVWPS